ESQQTLGVAIMPGEDWSAPTVRFRAVPPFQSVVRPSRPNSLLTRLGFQLLEGKHSLPGPWRDHFVMAPMWFLFLLIAVPTAWWFFGRERRLKRLRTGRCKNCGYDLRESRERCPECGQVFAAH